VARCYKFAISAIAKVVIKPILQAPDRLQNPRETKAFVIGNQVGKWSITTVQIGNNFAHTVRDKSRRKMAQLCGFREVAASQSKIIGHSDLIKSAVFCGLVAIRF